MPWPYGVVPVTIPVVPVSFDEPYYSSATNQAPIESQMNQNTMTIVLGNKGLYFGEIKAFTESFYGVRDKIIIPLEDRRPDLDALIDEIREWRKIKRSRGTVLNKIAILLPQDDWPMAIVIQVIHRLNRSDLFDHVVLASGFSHK